MPNPNTPGTEVDPSERTIDGGQNLEAESMSADADEQDEETEISD
ncbi:MAG: hypothetical protein QOE46_1160 [Acidobacteriota bacterium]|jgi:hypothetical protein|nr:hypothetical protein [Acidobacteriota bacterium]